MTEVRICEDLIVRPEKISAASAALLNRLVAPSFFLLFFPPLLLLEVLPFKVFEKLTSIYAIIRFPPLLLLDLVGDAVVAHPPVFGAKVALISGSCVGSASPGAYAAYGCRVTLNSSFIPGETFDATFIFSVNAGAALTQLPQFSGSDAVFSIV